VATSRLLKAVELIGGALAVVGNDTNPYTNPYTNPSACTAAGVGR
jgi:hypothetical protein